MNSNEKIRRHIPEILYSIIVPVYNAETTLHRCIDSILAQTEPNFELILVNDGSKDSSASIIDEYASLDKRIKVLHKVNGGVSSARNLGLSIIRGKYVTFIDSDDFVSPDYLSSFNDENADLVIGGVICLENNQEYICQSDTVYYYNKSNFGDIIIDHNNKAYIRSPWCKIYKSSIIRKNDLTYNTNIHFAEDYFFTLEFLNFCNSVKIIPQSHYYYILPIHRVYKMDVLQYDTAVKTYCEAIKNLNYTKEGITQDIKINKRGLFCVLHIYISHLRYIPKFKEISRFITKKAYRHTAVEDKELYISAKLKRIIEISKLLLKSNHNH